MKAYQGEEDLIGQFVDERCLVTQEGTVRAGELYKAFRAWSEEQGLKPIGAKRFAKEMEVHYQKGEDRHGRFLWVLNSAGWSDGACGGYSYNFHFRIFWGFTIGLYINMLHQAPPSTNLGSPKTCHALWKISGFPCGRTSGLIP